MRLAGLEPAKRVFSSLLIIAFLCAILLTFIHGFPSYVNGYFAPRGRHGQKKLCGIVRLCGKCAVVGGGLNLCGNCAGALPGQHCKRAVAGHCARLARLVAGLVAGCGSPRGGLVGRARNLFFPARPVPAGCRVGGESGPRSLRHTPLLRELNFWKVLLNQHQWKTSSDFSILTSPRSQTTHPTAPKPHS